MTHNNLKLHCAYGDTVWYSDDSLSIQHSELNAKDFISTYPIAKFKQVSLLASPDNAALACNLYELFNESTQIRLVFGPEDRDITETLHGLVNTQYRSAIMHKAEYFSYWLTALVESGPSDKLDKALRFHPTWPFLSFIPFMDYRSIVHVLAEIGDPRRFINPFKPNRLSRLYSYLGVNRANARRFFEDETPGVNFDRAMSVFHSWHNEKACEYYRKNKPIRPEDFLWRVYMMSPDQDSSLTKVSKKLLNYIYFLWRAKLTTHREVKFMPSMFFKRDDEMKAFYKHIGLSVG